MGKAQEYIDSTGLETIALDLLSDSKMAAYKSRNIVSGNCPFHMEKTPGGAFFYNQYDDTAFCFSCGQCGDIVNVFSAVNGCSASEGFKLFFEKYRPEALKTDKYSTVKQVGTKKPTEKLREIGSERKNPPEKWEEKAAAFVEYSVKNLKNHPEIKKYLVEKRGISEEFIELYRLGYNPSDTYRPVTGWGLPHTINKEGTVSKIWLPQGLVIPIFDEADSEQKILRVQVRRFDPEILPEIRYLTVRGSGYITPVLNRDSRIFVVVESYLDGLLLLSREIVPKIGIVVVGSAAQKPDAMAFSVLNKSAVILNALDYDLAGAKSFEWWHKNFEQVKRWPVPSGKDPGEYFATGGDILEWVRSGLPKGLLMFGDKTIPDIKIKCNDVQLHKSISKINDLLRAAKLAIWHEPNRTAIVNYRGEIPVNSIPKGLGAYIYNDEILYYLDKITDSMRPNQLYRQIPVR